MDAPAPALSHSAGPFYAREKASPRNMHPDVLAGVEATNKGNKQKLSEKKADVISMRQKLQQDVGRFQAMEYFDSIKEERLTWVDVLFNDGKLDSYDESVKYSCHCEKEQPTCVSTKLGDIF
jgi:hypothetical protein